MLAQIALVLAAGAAPAGFRVPLDSAQSSISVQLCVAGTCDTDTSPLSGFLEIALTPMAAPSSISFQDFDLQATQTFTFLLDYGFLGRIDATGTGVGTFHAAPGTGWPFAPIVGDAYTFTDVPYLKRGTVQHQATGFACLMLQQAGKLCADTIDLAPQAAATMPSVNGSIQITAGVVRISGTMTFSQPLDVDNPSLGTMSGTATLNGSAPLPARGDFDGDGDVDLSDFGVFRACFNGPNRSPIQTGCDDKDLDADDDVDLADFGLFRACFNGPNRPPACG